MLDFTLEIATKDRKTAVGYAKRQLMELFGLKEWPTNLTIDASIAGDDDEFTEWEFEVYRD